MSAPDHTALLDQLQAQVNLVLEQSGRVFAAVNASPKTRPAAQITKLQHILPVASNRFHQALDQLENELQMAALVMRRDLALCREQASSAGGEGVAKVSSEAPSAEQPSAESKNPEHQVPDDTEASSNQDVSMHDAPQDSVPEKVISEEKEPAPDVESNQPTTVAPSPKDAKPDDPSEVVNTSGEKRPGLENGGLQIETTIAEQDSKADQNPSEEKAPDTATGDLDSLFNDPVSGGDASAGNAFDFDQNNTNDLDFGTFGAGFDSTSADNDNISSLLPGLEDYANTQTNAATDVMDFGSFFDTNDDGQNTGMDQQGSGEQRDTTFDDLMDLANFEGLDGDENNNGNNHNADLDFDSLFN